MAQDSTAPSLTLTPGLKAWPVPRWILAWPALAWWIIFFVLPLAWIVLYSFGSKPQATEQGFVSLKSLSLDNYLAATSELFFNVFLGTLQIAGIGTIACALIGLPVAYTLAYYVAPRWRPLLVFLLILPFWTSFLLRTFAWRIILAPQGTLSKTLQSLGILDGPLLVLDTSWAVQLGIVYNYLPVMILPIYVAFERIDPALAKASMDLGAGPIRTFFQVTLPLAAPGLFGGLLLTFILAAGDYVVPTILGGTKGLMVGNLVATQILSAQNLPIGAAMAILLILMLALTVIVGIVLLWAVSRALRTMRGAAL
ncbi:ABC transporter permease [Rhodoligotrophos ferricapiens]|uniref:ABC transporter permease n=1 Tax=Rhodoligotrophos ferricapiens TaxID=3069264 RepID=UPI00315C653E